MTSREAQTQLLTSWAGILFITGKIVRFLLFFIFLFSVLSSSNTLASYNREQVILFFLVFNLVDIMIQFFFRGVYTFRFRVASGDYDIDLCKPLPTFFRPIFGSTDILDFITLLPLWAYFFWFTYTHQLLINLEGLVLFILLLVNSLLVGFAFHLFVCSVCVITLNIDHLIMVYRNLTDMARFPTDIYKKGIQYFLTFTIPVVILITVPAKAFMGFLSWQWVVVSLVIGGVFLFSSLWFWRFSLKHYSSASS